VSDLLAGEQHSPDSVTTLSGNGIDAVYVRYAKIPITKNPKIITKATPWIHPLPTMRSVDS
jgi:hypothetical protein